MLISFQVVFTEKVQQFKNLSTKYALVEEEYKIAFDNAYIQNAYKFLFINVCKKCCNHPIFDDFDELQNHMQHKHKLYCCKLCVKDLKVNFLVRLYKVYKNSVFNIIILFWCLYYLHLTENIFIYVNLTNHNNRLQI